MTEIINYNSNYKNSEAGLSIHSLNESKELKIVLRNGFQKVDLTLSFDKNRDSISISNFLGSSINSNCLALCGIGVIGPILDCWNKSKGNWNAFIACLKSQGHALGTSTVACLLGCTA